MSLSPRELPRRNVSGVLDRDLRYRVFHVFASDAKWDSVISHLDYFFEVDNQCIQQTGVNVN